MAPVRAWWGLPMLQHARLIFGFLFATKTKGIGNRRSKREREKPRECWEGCDKEITETGKCGRAYLQAAHTRKRCVLLFVFLLFFLFILPRVFARRMDSAQRILTQKMCKKRERITYTFRALAATCHCITMANAPSLRVLLRHKGARRGFDKLVLLEHQALAPCNKRKMEIMGIRVEYLARRNGRCGRSPDHQNI